MLKRAMKKYYKYYYMIFTFPSKLIYVSQWMFLFDFAIDYFLNY